MSRELNKFAQVLQQLTSQVALLVKKKKNLPAIAGDLRNMGSIPGWEISWRWASQPTPILLPGEFHGQRSLAGYSPWGCT